jgi:hypothetical protein
MGGVFFMGYFLEGGQLSAAAKDCAHHIGVHLLKWRRGFQSIAFSISEKKIVTDS